VADPPAAALSRFKTSLIPALIGLDSHILRDLRPSERYCQQGPGKRPHSTALYKLAHISQLMEDSECRLRSQPALTIEQTCNFFLYKPLAALHRETRHITRASANSILWLLCTFYLRNRLPSLL
jgi:hypothetical protein